MNTNVTIIDVSFISWRFTSHSISVCHMLYWVQIAERDTLAARRDRDVMVAS